MAKQRSWIEFASATLNNIAKLYNAKTEATFELQLHELSNKWCRLEQNVGDANFFNNDNFTLVDAAFAPVFRYFNVFEEIIDIKFLQYYPKVAKWRNSLIKHESVAKAVSDEYPTLLIDFLSTRDSHLGELTKSYQQLNSTN